MNELEVGQLAQSLYDGYLAYDASMRVLQHPKVDAVLHAMQRENTGPARVPIGSVARRDGTEISYHLLHAVETTAGSMAYRDTYERLWLGGALLTLGDALSAENYFDRGPDLELIRHLRNGIAHGNRFNLRNQEPRRPAHFTGADQTSSRSGITVLKDQGPYFEVDADSQGMPVLFEFMGPGDVLDLLQFVSWRLIRIGNGDPAHDLFSQRVRGPEGAPLT